MIDLLLGRGGWLILLSIFICLILHYLPMGETFSFARPAWMVLLIIYWGHVLPSRFGIWSSAIIGLYLDVMLSSAFGVYACALTVVAYLTHLLHRRIRVFSSPQQMLVVSVFVGIYLIILRLLENFSGTPAPFVLWYWLPVLTSVLVWPWFFVILESLRRRYLIAESNI